MPKLFPLFNTVKLFPTGYAWWTLCVIKITANPWEAAASQGLAVILITHNVHHAYPVGNSFTVLNRGKSLGTYEKKDISREKLLSMMAGGEELNKLEVELQEMNRSSTN